jgi:hypothetical protein
MEFLEASLLFVACNEESRIFLYFEEILWEMRVKRSRDWLHSGADGLNKAHPFLTSACGLLIIKRQIHTCPQVF